MIFRHANRSPPNYELRIEEVMTVNLGQWADGTAVRDIFSLPSMAKVDRGFNCVCRFPCDWGSPRRVSLHFPCDDSGRTSPPRPACPTFARIRSRRRCSNICRPTSASNPFVCERFEVQWQFGLGTMEPERFMSSAAAPIREAPHPCAGFQKVPLLYCGCCFAWRSRQYCGSSRGCISVENQFQNAVVLVREPFTKAAA